MKKKLFIYAHYYIPDTASTGQILAELAEGLLDQFIVTVICVVPSYEGLIEDKYKSGKFFHEKINGVNVIRVRVPEFSKSNKASRIKNILAYFFGSILATIKVGNQDYVMAVSQPPILGGLLGVIGKWKFKRIAGKKCQKVKYIYQIQDFNPEQVLAVNYSKSKLITSIMMWLDKFSCRQADLIITVGRDLVETLERRFEKQPEKLTKVTLINNWVDEKEIYPLEARNKKVDAFKIKYGLMSLDGSENKFVIMYSGNIGLYYDLENLIKVVKKFKPGTKAADGREVVFAFVGAGSVLDKLQEYVKQNHMDNVTFIPYQTKEDLIYSINAGDVHWCVNAKGIKGVSCPSKYYGLAAASKTILGVLEEGSEVRCLIEETNSGLVCEPGDYETIEKNITWVIDNAGTEELLNMGRRGYDYLHKNLTREKSIEKYAEEILKL